MSKSDDERLGFKDLHVNVDFVRSLVKQYSELVSPILYILNMQGIMERVCYAENP